MTEKRKRQRHPDEPKRYIGSNFRREYIEALSGPNLDMIGTRFGVYRKTKRTIIGIPVQWESDSHYRSRILNEYGKRASD